jgi:hypothetical protein
MADQAYVGVIKIALIEIGGLAFRVETGRTVPAM